MLKQLIIATLLSFTTTSTQAFTVTIEDPTYDEIVFEIMSNPEQAGFESDNHTFSVLEQAISGKLVIDLPPAIFPAD